MDNNDYMEMSRLNNEDEDREYISSPQKDDDFKPGLRLTDDHHYFVDNRPLPGVTATIQANFGSRPYWSEWHAGRGKAVHMAIHYLTENRLNWNTVDPAILPRVHAFQKFWQQIGAKVIASEIMLHSNRYQFAGTIDLILRDGDDLVLADIKSSIEPSVELQLGAYKILWEENKGLKLKSAWVIELRDNGSYNLKIYRDLKRAQNLFLSALTIANFKQLNYGEQL